MAEKRTWQNTYKPGRYNADGNFVHTVKAADIMQGKKRHLNRRAQAFKTLGTSSNKTAMLNGMGFMTKAQKNAYRPLASKDGIYNIAGKMMTAEEAISYIGQNNIPNYSVGKNQNILYRSGKASKMEAAAFGLGKAFIGYGILNAGSGGAPVHEGFTQAFGLGAFDVGLGVGINKGGAMIAPGTTAAGKFFKGGMKGILSLGRGIGTGLLYSVAVEETLNQIMEAGTNSNNWIRRLDDKKTRAKIALDISTSEMQSVHVSQRQRIMNKLSKNAINDRGQYMGNEAMALRGVL